MSGTRQMNQNGKRKLEESSDDELSQTDDDSAITESKKPSMPTYGKYNILKILKENHCLIADTEQLLKAFPRNKRYDAADIKKFIDKSAKKSQALTVANNKSSEFKRANNLIKLVESSSEQKIDIPLSLKTITDVYEYEEEEVDLRMLYQTLTNLSLGFPTATLDNATNAFLYGAYKEFVNKVNTKEFQADVQKYQDIVNSRQYIDIPDEKHQIGNDDMHQVVKSTLTSPSMNPLNIPFSLLHKPKNSS